MKKRDRAFTMLEAVVVMGLLAALAVIVLPSILSGSHSTDLSSTTQEVISAARDAQSQAIDQTGNVPWGIHFSNPTSTPPFYALFTGSSYVTGLAKSTYVLPSTLSFISSTLPVGSSVDVLFSPVSGIASASTTIGIEVTSQPTLVSFININAAGEVNQGTNGTSTSSGPTTTNLIYVTDNSNKNVQEFGSTGAYVAQWGTPGTGNGQFSGPLGAAVAPNGNVYVVDSGGNARVQEFSSTGAYITQWGTSGSGNGQFNRPNSVAVAPNGNVYVTDTGNCRVQEFNSSGGYITKWGSCGSTSGKFENPEGIAIAPNGDVYVADSWNENVQIFNANGLYLTRWTSFGPGNQSGFPYGVVVAPNGNIYVADIGNNAVEEFNASGTYITQWGSYGTGNSQFDSPFAITADSSGNIYVADTYNYRVQEFSSTGAYITQWGTQGTGNGQFTAPFGIAY